MSGYVHGKAKPLARRATPADEEAAHAKNVVDIATWRAAQIIADARRQARLIVLEAEEDAGMIREQAFETGCALAERNYKNGETRIAKADKEQAKMRLEAAAANGYRTSRHHRSTTR